MEKLKETEKKIDEEIQSSIKKCMDLALVFEKANNELKSKKRVEYKDKNKKIIENISKRIGRRLMNKVYDYLTSINDEALPRMFISNHE